MKQLGYKKTKTKVPGHQDCSSCHPPLKNKKQRARQQAREEIHSQVQMHEMREDLDR